MGEKTIRFCDVCGKEFETASKPGARYIIAKVYFQTDSYTDAAGQSGQRNTFALEMHKWCWEKFAKLAADKEKQI